MFNFDDPKYRPLWVRVALVITCLAWGAFEAMSGGGFWAVLFLGMGAFLVWRLLITFDANADE